MDGRPTAADHSVAWRSVLELDRNRSIVSGSARSLRQALQAGADLRIYSEFYHDEHIDTDSRNHELVQESMDMRVTCLIDDRWAAGILNLRQPVQLPDQFGPRPSLSLFLYNEDGQQAIARPFLDGIPASGPTGISPPVDHSEMPKYHELDRWDDGSNAPSSNFIYDFEKLRYFVREDWRQVLAHDADGSVHAGSITELAEAFRNGAEFKVGIRGLCDDLAAAGVKSAGGPVKGLPPLPHEVFVQLGSCYYYTGEQVFIGGSHPLPRVCPDVPLRYRTGGWDYAWALLRTDGQASLLVYDPYTLRPRRQSNRFAMRWFCR